ncbi:MAG TPA: hypothetical protein DIT25_01755 [Candidatus Moranbacteria bacterium]|nr:hypothetical protein [Candidatus Moranbacteria bacterium]
MKVIKIIFIIIFLAGLISGVIFFIVSKKEIEFEKEVAVNGIVKHFRQPNEFVPKPDMLYMENNDLKIEVWYSKAELVDSSGIIIGLEKLKVGANIQVYGAFMICPPGIFTERKCMSAQKIIIK